MKMSVEFTICELEALISMADSAKRYHAGTDTEYERSVARKAVKARNELMGKAGKSREPEQLTEAKRNGDFNMWDRRRETHRKPALPLFESEDQ